MSSNAGYAPSNGFPQTVFCCRRVGRRDVPMSATGEPALHRRGSSSVFRTRFGKAVLLALALAAALAGCATRPGPETLDPVAEASVSGKDVTLLAVTDRSPVEGSVSAFGDGRGKLRYERFTMRDVGSPADDRPAGAVISSGSDPSRSFVTVSRRELDDKAFVQAVDHMQDDGADTVVVFVHGYNYSYPEAVLRLAQLSADAGVRAVPILFSWPAQADFRAYVAARDSTTYARDDLVELLTMLSRSRSPRRIAVLGHSMGAWLVMEALRQLRLEGRDDVIARFEVGLAAPDIDIDVFRRQAAVVGRLSPPLTVLVSADDRALAVSSRIAGGKPRLGLARADDPELQEVARRLGMRIIDISTLPASDGFKHDRFVNFAARYSAAVHDDRLVGGVQQAGVYLLDATGRILSAPFSQTARLLDGSQ
jgi:esterase/lipase superfamily enzyme